MTTAVRERGLKRTCQADACGVRFYDLNRTTISCPECGAGFIAPPPTPPRVFTSKTPTSHRSYSRNLTVAERLPVDAPSLDAEEGNEVAEEADDVSIDVENTAADQPDAILELDITAEDIEPIVPADETTPD